MLPEAANADAERPELSVHATMSLAVSVDFGGPEGSIGLRDVAAFLAAVPKAAVHEDGELARREEKVGLSCDLLWMGLPPADALAHERHLEAQFGALVALAANRSHNLRTRGRDFTKFAVGEFRA